MYAHSAYELCFCDRADWEGCFGQLYNGRTGTPARPMHRSQQPIRIGYTDLVLQLVLTIYGASCTFLELIFPWSWVPNKITEMYRITLQKARSLLFCSKYQENWYLPLLETSELVSHDYCTPRSCTNSQSNFPQLGTQDERSVLQKY